MDLPCLGGNSLNDFFAKLITSGGTPHVCRQPYSDVDEGTLFFPCEDTAIVWSAAIHVRKVSSPCLQTPGPVG